jgi:hypothetical protein
MTRRETNVKRLSLMLVPVLLACSGSVACEDTSAREGAVTETVMAWLSQVDSGEYGSSWDSSSEVFQNSIGREQWEDSLRQVRAPLGDVVSRTVSQIKHLSEVPNAPKGRYTTVQFDTSFDNRPGTIERVSAVEAEGAWRVSGYYVQ